MGYHDGMDERAGGNQLVDVDWDTDGTPGLDASRPSGDAQQSDSDQLVDGVQNPGNDLRRSFERSLYDVHLPDGTVTLLVRRAPLGNSAPIRDRRLAIVTAYNPGHERPGEAANRAANERLRVEVERRGWAWYPAIGYSPERDHTEPSFAVLDVGEDEATELGRQFGQAAVFVWDGRRGRLAWCSDSGAH